MSRGAICAGRLLTFLSDRNRLVQPGSHEYEVCIMATVNLNDAKARLEEIISNLHPGEQLVIVEAGEPLATLTRTGRTQWPCTAGSAKHTQHRMSPDFDAPLEEFREYME